MLKSHRNSPLPEGEGGAQSEANGKVRGYAVAAFSSARMVSPTPTALVSTS
jgi:hypothetical protein